MVREINMKMGEAHQALALPWVRRDSRWRRAAMQIVYEHKLRPAEKLHLPWVERVTGQLLSACANRLMVGAERIILDRTRSR